MAAATAACAQPHIVVIGAGLVGLTSAHALLEQGFRVTIVDRQPGVAGECSFANAALLMRSYSRPKTATPLQMLRWMTSRKHPVHVSWRALVDPAMTSFGLRFFLAGPQTQAEIFDTSQITNELAELSISTVDDICKQQKLEVAFIDGGLLMFFSDKAKLDATIAEAEETFTVDQRDAMYKVVSPEECVELEPLLEPHAPGLAGGVFWPKDKTVCSLTFSQQLASSLISRGAEMVLGQEVVGTSQEGDSTALSLSSNSKLVADGIVVAAGVGSGKLLRRLEVASSTPIPLYGMRGHSMTIDVSHLQKPEPNNHVIQRSLCDGDSMSFFSPLPETLTSPGKSLMRLAAFGDFDGWGYGPGAVRQWRLDQLYVASERNFGPHLFNDSAKKAWTNGAPAAQTWPGAKLCSEDDALTRWCGLRPMSPDGLPVVGSVGVKGRTPVFVNAGHGALGWTLSAGTAEVLASRVAAAIPCQASVSGAPRANAEQIERLATRMDPSRFRWPSVLRKASRMLLRR